MKTILVPVDFSANSKKALDYACVLAQKLNLRIIILHAYNPSKAEKITNSYKLWTEKTLLGTPEEMELELMAWCESVKSMENPPLCSGIFIKCDLLDEISYMVDSHSVDLVIMGTKGASAIKEVFIGSNTARVIELVSCPVIAVPESFEYKKIKKVIFATDYHERDINCIKLLAGFAEKFDAELNIVHMDEGELVAAYEQDMYKYFKEKAEREINYGKMKFNLKETDNLVFSLFKYIESEEADLFALSLNERILKSSLLNRGISWKFAHHIDVPFMAFHHNDIFN